MSESQWCEHADIISKYTMLRYQLDDKEVVLRVQSWVCPVCGVYGAETEVVEP